VLLTLNDHEALQEKKTRNEKQLRLTTVQTWGILITSICLIITTFYTFFATKDNSLYEYFPQNGYILRVNKTNISKCIIVTSGHKEVIRVMEQTYGLPSCGS
jgi:hypothetical protein